MGRYFADGKWVFDSSRPRKVQSGRNKFVAVASTTTDANAKKIADALNAEGDLGHDPADAIGIAFAMGDVRKAPYAALEAAEMVPNAAIAMMKVLGPRPPWNEDDNLGDWESFLNNYVRAMAADGLNTGATVQDFVDVLLVLLGRMGYLCDICGKRGVDFSHSASCTRTHDKGLPD